jgi:hypothetical protein
VSKKKVAQYMVCCVVTFVKADIAIQLQEKEQIIPEG